MYNSISLKILSVNAVQILFRTLIEAALLWTVPSSTREEGTSTETARGNVSQ